MPARSELSIPLGPTARVDRTHPALNSPRVLIADLTGPQRIEAKASDVVAAVALQVKRDAPFLPKLVEALGGVESLDHLTRTVSDICGNRAISELKVEVIKRFGVPNDYNGLPFAVREATLQWARKEDSHPQVAASTRKVVRASLKIEPKSAFKPSKSGKPRGPGSHTRGTRGKEGNR